MLLFLLDWSIPLKFIMSSIKSTLPKLWTLFWGNVSHRTDWVIFSVLCVCQQDPIFIFLVAVIRFATTNGDRFSVKKTKNQQLSPKRERNGNLWGYHFKAATRSFHFVDSGDPCGRKQHEHHRLLSHKDIHLVGVCISFDLKKDKTVSEPVRGPLRYIWVEDLNAQLHIITNNLIATLLFYLIQSSIKTWQWFV